MMLHIVVPTVNQYLNGADMGRNIVFGRYYKMMAMGAEKLTCDGANLHIRMIVHALSLPARWLCNVFCLVA